MPGISLDTCVLDFGFLCLSAGELLLPLLLLALLVAVGGWSARRNDPSFARLRRQAFAIALALIAIGGLPVLWFAVVEPETIAGIDTSPAHQTIWILAMALLAAGLSLLLGMAAYALGGWIGGRSPRQARQNPVPLIIAIDGPAASGKGTLAKRVAVHYGLDWLDTGLLYRAVARDVAARGGNLNDAAAACAAARALDPATLADSALRGPKAGDAASLVAKIPEVRQALLEYQRDFARRDRGAVLDGRDIGTVICPDAHAKIFVTASDEARARRRFLEHQARGDSIAYEELLADIRRRDARDSGRTAAPMQAAADAIALDSTALNADEVFVLAIAKIEAVLGRAGR